MTLSQLLLLLLLFPAAGNAAAAAGGKGAQPPPPFNVTEILGRHEELTLFNYLLTKTRLADDINTRGTAVTLLAPVNADVDWLLRRSARMARAALVELLSVHVVLDYIDASKLAALPRGVPTVATTLYQTFGAARDRCGLLTITNLGSGAGGGVVFASAAAGALLNATFTRAVTARPYNVSVLQISNFVVPPGVVTRPRSTPPPPPPRIKSMSVPPPSPSPLPISPTTSTMLPPPTSLPSEEEIGLDEIPARAPAPSRGHALAPSGIGAAASMILWSLLYVG